MDLAAAARELKGELEHLLPRDTVDRPLPIGGGRLVGRFGMIPVDRFEALLNEEDDDEAAALTIVESCRGLLMRDAQGELQPITHDDGTPVRFDLRFARVFGLEPAEETGVAIVTECWKTRGGDVNWIALRSFGRELVGWMSDTATPLLDEVVGKSPAAPTSSSPAGRPSAA